MAPKLKTLTRELSKRGPHRVLRGNLALAGQPGVVYTPETGFNLPAVAFAHGWMTSPHRYEHTLQHLASWGIVVAAPDSERGPVPSHLGLAADLRASLDICVGVRLGPGQISVHPDRLGLIGHGMGAGVAVLAAAQRAEIGAVAALFPAPTAPKAENYASKITAPGLILAGADDVDSLTSNARPLSQAWGGPVIARTVDDARDAGLIEGRRLLGALGFGGSERKTQATTRSLLTGFLLQHLAGEKRYEALTDETAEISHTALLTEEPAQSDARVSQLLRR
ncbi:pimeloyl-ACP methyl ester carboxylesterase [Rhodococcus sp. 27YEA15]|uniref:dienelactone hydrolase family protein n=1 Tax=Rhodococcus sp. 27YEA15 TaxID=3156259 RepID=UPI003C7EC0B4